MVALHDNTLNGSLADEMGLGKTIQVDQHPTIAPELCLTCSHCYFVADSCCMHYIDAMLHP